MFSNSLSLLALFFSTLFISGLSGFLLLYSRIPLSFVRFHIVIIALPPLVSLFALFNTSESNIVGPWHLDFLSWLMAFFVLTIGLVIQRFSVRYLLGDRSYRKYFTLFTSVTGAASLTWLTDDLRLLIIFWGITLGGLTLLIGLNSGWKEKAVAATLSSRLLFVSWLALLVAMIWLSHVTGNWTLSQALTNDSLTQLTSWEKTGINLLLVLSVMIPAAQWPFHRWLIESVVAPTPVSAIMHAGLVNVGGILLTRFSPLFNGDLAQIILIVFASLSVLIGTGISLVQVDYKRQLVGSTIAQMGFMLIQCALGAYLAAIIHLILHGLFKATLFLQAGSAVHRYKGSARVNKNSSYLWVMAGYALVLLTGTAFWFMTSGERYQLVNTLILAWSLSFSWRQLIALGEGRIVRIAGFFIIGVSASVYFIIHRFFYELLHTTVTQSVQPPMSVVIFVVCLLILGSVIGVLAPRYRSSISFAVLYLWFVKLGEGQSKALEGHPAYLKSRIWLKEVIRNEHYIRNT